MGPASGFLQVSPRLAWGDAAHPTTPNLGQGACQAIESAWCWPSHGPTRRASPRAWVPMNRLGSTARRRSPTSRGGWGKVLAYENPLKCWLRNRLFGLLGGLTVRQTEKLIGVEV
jgi:hypothetical protein